MDHIDIAMGCLDSPCRQRCRIIGCNFYSTSSLMVYSKIRPRNKWDTTLCQQCTQCILNWQCPNNSLARIGNSWQRSDCFRLRTDKRLMNSFSSIFISLSSNNIQHHKCMRACLLYLLLLNMGHKFLSNFDNKFIV